MKKSVLITGAAGFIGSHTVQEFVENGWYVCALVHRSKSDVLEGLQNDGCVQIIEGDITSYDSMKNTLSQYEITPDAIVHCAGRASDVGRRSVFRKTNFESTQHLVRLVKEMDIQKFVFVSTTDVYGLKDFHGEKEDELEFLPLPCHPYPEFKILSEQWIRQELPPERFSIIRPAAVWGEDDPTITKRMIDFLRVSPFIIHFGKWRGENIWSLVHVTTVAKALYLAATSAEAEGKAINAVDDNNTTMDTFYQQIADTYFPHKKFKRLYLPMWIGVIFGSLISTISNLLNTKHPITDPSIYALNSISHNLNFNHDKLDALIEAGKKNGNLI